ncbi:hypothetical protein AMTR_s00130p00109580 [Amborella trichopoda]|uniref:Uncharacterized protein n=1 Tax=Amborella trichopoda TaxID=13333 RepID=W1NRP6_AMBTC|nr:hypothetical protein AMTR_s00130p00109580 [Amborella trichopoda]
MAPSILTALRSSFGHVSLSSDSSLVQVDQSELEAIPTSADGIWNDVRYHLAHRLGSRHPSHVNQAVSHMVEVLGPGTSWIGAGSIDTTARLLITSRTQRGGPELGTSCAGAGANGNDARLLVF